MSIWYCIDIVRENFVNQPPIQFFHSTWWVYSSLSILIQSKNIYFCQPLSCYFSGLKIEIFWVRPMRPPQSLCITLTFWLFKFLFHYSSQLNVYNNNKHINSHKFSDHFAQYVWNHRPCHKNTPFQYIFRLDTPCVEQGYSKERTS